MKKIFVSYARKDAIYLDELYKGLKHLIINREAELWSDTDILIGESWEESISRLLDVVDIYIVFISEDYNAIKGERRRELDRIFDQRKRAGKLLIALMLSREAKLNERLRHHSRVVERIPSDPHIAYQIISGYIKNHKVLSRKVADEKNMLFSLYEKSIDSASLNVAVSGSNSITGAFNIFIDSERRLKNRQQNGGK